MMALLVLCAFISFVSCALLLRLGQESARRYGWSVPQRFHLGDVPRLGGAAMFVACSIGWATMAFAPRMLGLDYAIPFDGKQALTWWVVTLAAVVSGVIEDVASRRPGVHLVLVGPDEGGLARLHEGVMQARDRLHAVGRSAEPELYMAAADLLCLPSYREGFGLSLLEAAATGLPVLATRIYGIVDAVEDQETGLLVPTRDSAALAHALDRLVGDAALRTRLGRAGRERAERVFSKEMMQVAWRGLYERQLRQVPAAKRNAGNAEAGTR